MQPRGRQPTGDRPDGTGGEYRRDPGGEILQVLRPPPDAARDPDEFVHADTVLVDRPSRKGLWTSRAAST
jgi:hypothetical protein